MCCINMCCIIFIECVVLICVVSSLLNVLSLGDNVQCFVVFSEEILAQAEGATTASPARR